MATWKELFETWLATREGAIVATLGLSCLVVALPFMQTGMFGPIYAYDLLIGETGATAVKLAPPKTWVAMSLTVLISFLVAVTRCFPFLVALPAIWTLYLTGGKPLSEHPVASFLYIMCALTILGLLAWRGHISKNPLAAGVLLLMAEAILPFFDFYPTVYGSLFVDYTVFPVNVLTLLAIWLLSRLVLKAIHENLSTLREAKWLDLCDIAKETLKLWWPMGLIFIVFTALNIYVQSWVITPMIIESIDLDRLEMKEPPDSMERIKLLGVPTDQQSKSTSEALTRNLEARSAKFKGEINQTAADINAAGNSRIDQIVPFARQRLPARFPGTDQRRCGINPGCLIANGVKSMINSGYISARESMMQELNAKVAEAKGDVAQARKNVVDHIIKEVDRFTHDATTRVQQTASGLSLLGWILQLYAIVVLIESFLIVFARLYYKTEGVVIDRADDAADVPPGKITVSPSELQLTRRAPMKTYFVFKVVGPNAVDRRRIPQPLSLALARIFTGRYMMCLIDLSDRQYEQGCEIKVDAPREIIVWQINKDQEVFIRLSDLIGFSETCRLGRRISLSVASLVFGRTFFQYIKGPGTLYLKSESNAIAGGGDDTRQIMHSSSLMAWSRNSEFNIVSSLTIIDVFFSGFSIRKLNRKSYLVAYDTSQKRRVGTIRGIWRMARTFVLPF
jgi:Mitochondrial biogenesis AIM24